LISKVNTKDREKALDELIRFNMNTVHYICNKYKWCNISYEDLVQYGVLGIISAADNFDHTKNTKFNTFAYHYILGRIRRALELYNNTIRLPAHINLSMGKISHLDPEENVSDEELMKYTDKRYKLNHLQQALEAKRQKIIDLDEIFDVPAISENSDRNIVVREFLKVFTDREQKILELKYGFESGVLHTHREIDKILNLDSEQIVYHAFKRIKRDYDVEYLLDLLRDE
jgi:RNA polymerase nonessential primary-like sigma factor